jgi:hypothetical protein
MADQQHSPQNLYKLDRSLTAEEHHLIEYLLRHGEGNASGFLPQLADTRIRAEWYGGCPILRFILPETTPPADASRPVLARMLGSIGDEPVCVTLRQRDGYLHELEIYATTGRLWAFILPHIATLRSWND